MVKLKRKIALVAKLKLKLKAKFRTSELSPWQQWPLLPR